MWHNKVLLLPYRRQVEDVDRDPTPLLTPQQAQNKTVALLLMYSFQVALKGRICWPVISCSCYDLSYKNEMSEFQCVLCSVNDSHFQNIFNLFTGRWPGRWTSSIFSYQESNTPLLQKARQAERQYVKLQNISQTGSTCCTALYLTLGC